MKSLAINFDLFGNERTGSSRLRGYKLAAQLQRMGHRATIGKTSTPVDIKVFQKNRNFAQLAAAKKQGALAVFDFDDNYLLQDVGTKNDAIRMMNFADVVTVGSQLLYETAIRYHDRVYLFENPLDVRDETTRKANHEWQQRIGWFGNPCNLPALNALRLPFPVVTITENGDIPWRLETVDEELLKFDLILIPVAISDWGLSKNSNRMLKCVSLGIPFLASLTPEHVRTVEQLGLDPAHFLIAANESWETAVERLGDSYAERVKEILDARPRAQARYGIEDVTRRWLHQIQSLSNDARAPLPREDVAFCSEIDVVIWNETDQEKAMDTLQSLRGDEVAYHSVTIVSALSLRRRYQYPTNAKLIDSHADFFDLYSSLCRELEGCRGRHVLILKAGCQLRRGFFYELSQRIKSADLFLFVTQQNSSQLSFTAPPPVRWETLLLAPYSPAAVLTSTSSVRNMTSQSSRFAALCLWDWMIRAFAENPRLQLCEAPVIVIDQRVAATHPIACYAAFLEKVTPELIGELPGLDNEWDRLRYLLQSQVISTHHDLFARFMPTLLPELIKDRSVLTRQVKVWRDKEKKSQQRVAQPANGSPGKTKSEIKKTRLSRRLRARLSRMMRVPL